MYYKILNSHSKFPAGCDINHRARTRSLLSLHKHSNTVHVMKWKQISMASFSGGILMNDSHAQCGPPALKSPAGPEEKRDLNE